MHMNLTLCAAACHLQRHSSQLFANILMQIPRSKTVKAHPVAGLARINLTFRRLDPQTAARAPACKCGQKAVLKVCPC